MFNNHPPLSSVCHSVADCAQKDAFKLGDQIIFFTWSVMSGVWLAVAGIAYFMQWSFQQYENYNDGDDNDDANEDNANEDANEDDDANALEAEYIQEFYDELALLNQQQMPEKQMPAQQMPAQQVPAQQMPAQQMPAQQQQQYNTPRGPVLMAYDAQEHVFKYFTDVAAKLSYAVLDRVARQFAVEVLRVPDICVHARHELIKAQEKAAAQATQVAAAPVSESQVKSVFAQFKKYPAKTKTTKTTTEAIVTVEKANIFRFAGKLADALKTQQQQQPTVQPLEMDYATFKQLMREKKINE